MAITAYPFDDQDTSETQYSQLFRELQDSGVADDIAGSGFKVSADASGLWVDVQPGFAIVRGHAVLSTAVERISVSPPSALARIDRIVLRLNPATNGIVIDDLTGTSGGSAPSLTQTDTGIFEVPLGKVGVDPGVPTIAGDKVLDDRQFVGSRIGSWTTLTRPSSPRKSKLGLNSTTGRWEFWSGSAWADLAPAVDWSTIAGKPSTFTPSAHSHEWGDVTNKPSSFTPATHSHAWADVTAKPTTFTPAAHSHAWADVTAKPTTFAPTAHTHDYAATSHTHAYADSGHTHADPWTVGRANGSDRVHSNSPAGSGWYAAWVDGNHNFCHNTSSIRFKENVRDYAIDPDGVLALRPVIYDRKPTQDEVTGVWQDGQKNEFGLIAEEVNEHVPELVQWMDHGDGKGQVIETVRYDLLGVALLPVVQDHEQAIRYMAEELAALRQAVGQLLAERRRP